jgi:cystathionine gamma-synthase
MHPDTRAVHLTRFTDRNAGAIAPPIYLSTTFERAADGTLPHGYLYTRVGNPNRSVLEKALAELEGGTDALVFGSGQAALTALLQTLRPGDHVLAAPDTYYASLVLMREVFEPWGLSWSTCDLSDLAAVRAALRPTTRLIWVETPSNPQLGIVDIEALATLAHEVGARCAVDNTWATPVLQQPLSLGADVVMHSVTKYFGGHSDVLGGALVLRDDPEVAARLRSIQTLTGGVLAPFDCWLITRGIQTLPLRVRAQAGTAAVLAHWLSAHPAVERVYYPGLPAHPGHDIARQQMRGGFGAMLSFDVRGGFDAARRVAGAVRVFRRATSLGGVESLIEHRRPVEGPESTSPEGLLRLSVGLEHAEDLQADLDQALGQTES